MKEVGLTNEDRCNQVHDRAIIPWCPANTPPPFATLALVQNAGGGANTQDATISWVSLSARRRDAHNASSRLTNFSVEDRESRVLP